MTDEQLSSTKPPGGRSGAVFSRLAFGFFGGRMADLFTLEKLKEASVPVGFIVAFVLFIGPFLAWVDAYHAEFITASEASGQHVAIEDRLEIIEGKLGENTLATHALQTEFRARMSLQSIAALESKVYVLERDKADPGLVHETKRELEQARAYADCLLAGRSNCQLLEARIQ